MADRELSAEDLREKLFHTFTNRGVLDSLKSQLRNCLVTELQQSAKINLANGRKKPPEELSLFHQAANSLVVNHLKRCNFEYTLSVFLPESGTPKDKLLTIKDVLLILKIDPDSSLYRSLESSLSSKDSTKSFLWEFICQMSKHFCHSKETVAIQTEETSSIRASSIDEKLRFVDKAFSERAEKESEAWSTQAEQKIANFQRQCEERKRHELDAEVQRYKTTELARMRLEEREKCQKEIKMAKDQSEKDYSLKSEVLRVKEKEIMERLHRQQQIQEEEAYAQRQKMLEEMRMIRERENDFKRRQELDIKSVQLDQERVKTEVEKIKHIETTLKEQEAGHKQRAEDEVQRYKLQYQEEYQKKLHDLELREAQYKQDKDSFDKIKSTCMGYYDELEGKKEQLMQLQSQLEKHRYSIATLTHHKESLAQKLDELKDYRTVKESELSLQKDVESLQRQLNDLSEKDKDSRKTVKELTEKMAQPSPELIVLRSEVKAAKEDGKNKEKLSRERQRKLESRLETETQRCVEYQRLYEEHLLRQKEMEREMNDLQAALHHTQTVLRMELERRRASEASVSDMHDLAMPSPPLDPSSAKPSITDIQPRGRQDSEVDVVMNDTGSTLELIAHSKNVFDKLEKEARDLEDSYRRFQSRMKNTGMDQFTSVPPISVNMNTAGQYHPTELGVIRPSRNVRSEHDKADTQNDFVPLSWVPITEETSNKMSYGQSQPISYRNGTQSRPFTREDKDNITRFYSLPSFGVSQVTQNNSEQRYFGLSRPGARRPNNTVNVSDLIAKPGSPSVISAPIEHSPMDASDKDTVTTNRVIERHGESSTSTSRRPLSSTIDREKEGTRTGSRDTDMMTSLSAQRMSEQTVFVPAQGGAGRELNDSDSRRSSEISLSGGSLSVGTLNKPADQLDASWKKGRITEESEEKHETDGSARNVGGDTLQWNAQNTQISLDSTWGKTKGDSVFIHDKEQSLGDELSVSFKSDPSLPGTGEKLYASLDNAWKSAVPKDSEKERQEREKREREIREREEGEWEEQKRKRDELRRQREQEAWKREQHELAELQREQQQYEERDQQHEAKKRETHGSEEGGKGTESEGASGGLKTKDPEIDPVMLQYMKMIQTRKEEEKTKRDTQPSRKRSTSKDAVNTPSNSELSQGEDNLGSIEELSGDDGFDWG